MAGGFCHTHGYIIIKIDGIGYKAHRLAWLYMYGVWPNFIDHKNHNRSDNRIVNLRSVTNQENCKNASLRKDSSSRVCGVHWNKLERKWKAQINVDSKRIYLGCFDDLFEACCVRKSAENKHGFHLNHGC